MSRFEEIEQCISFFFEQWNEKKCSNLLKIFCLKQDLLKGLESVCLLIEKGVINM
jgi:hypothetical protein